MKNASGMTIREKAETGFLYGVFALYILFLLKLLLLSRVSLSDLFAGPVASGRSINLIPFHSIKAYLVSDSATIRSFAFGNVGGNILVFVPLGAYLALFRSGKRAMGNLLIVFTASLLAEIIQGLLGIGTADIDDIFLNCLGGFVGILGHNALVPLLRDEKKVRIVFAILSAIGLPILLYVLFVIRMRL